MGISALHWIFLLIFIFQIDNSNASVIVLLDFESYDLSSNLDPSDCSTGCDYVISVCLGDRKWSSKCEGNKDTIFDFSPLKDMYDSSHRSLNFRASALTSGRGTINGWLSNPVELIYDSYDAGTLVVKFIINNKIDASTKKYLGTLILNADITASSKKTEVEMKSYEVTGGKNSGDTYMKMNVQMGMYCDGNFYGEFCQNLCVGSDDCGGHFRCDAEGNKKCLSGWRGSFCDELISDDDRICKNLVSSDKTHGGHYGGYFDCNFLKRTARLWMENDYSTSNHYYGSFSFLLNVNNHYRFDFEMFITDSLEPRKPVRMVLTKWLTGFPKDQPYFDAHGYIDDQHNIVLVDFDSFRVCEKMQNITVTRIANGDICLNDGVCIPHGNTPADAFCCCKPGFGGVACEMKTTECPPHVCGYGRCRVASGQFICECPLGFEGPRCERKTGQFIPCDDGICQNGGSCIDNSENSYSCMCRSEFTGMQCEIVKSACMAGYYGERCDIHCIDTDDCSGHYRCNTTTGEKTCLSGYSGDGCTLRNYNRPDDPACPRTHEILTNINVETKCQNGGTCWNRICCCPPGFNGKLCELEIDECDKFPCRNEGFCIDELSSYRCVCKNEYEGKNCEIGPEKERPGIFDEETSDDGGGNVAELIGNLALNSDELQKALSALFQTLSA